MLSMTTKNNILVFVRMDTQDYHLLKLERTTSKWKVMKMVQSYLLKDDHVSFLIKEEDKAFFCGGKVYNIKQIYTVVAKNRKTPSLVILLTKSFSRNFCQKSERVNLQLPLFANMNRFLQQFL